nr:flagellar motor control protein ZomB [Corynebacterium caspium]
MKQPKWATLAFWSAIFSAFGAGIFAFIGGWQRRWISDDGLIVLRTVRNLLVGNGPVFNAGERVEANTSTIWQYLIWAVARVFRGARLEDIALWLALGLTTLAAIIAVCATARLYRGTSHALIFAPAGILIYLALPPARDFATSGLEWGLSIFWLAVLWWALVRWAEYGYPFFLAFWGGISWLVRPEFALYGGLVGLLLVAVSWKNWRQILLIAAAALPIPAGYQLFRMGYYGLLTPHTAVAKSATGSAWREGLNYLRDFNTPYRLWIACVLVILVMALLLWRVGVVRSKLAFRRSAAIAVLLGAGAIHVLYILRVGGDFMHGRMLLLPIFALLLPVAAIPIADLLRPRWGLDIPIAATVAVIMGWSGVVTVRGYDWQFPTGELTIVDERTFWTIATKQPAGQAPRYAQDFLAAPSMQNYVPAVHQAREANDAQVMQIRTGDNPATYTWVTVPRGKGVPGDPHLGQLPPTVYLINLGMTSMNAPLDVRVLDTMGLAAPIGARQPRKEGWRIGHDKILPVEWQLADSGADINLLPDFVDKSQVAAARVALSTPEFAELFESYRAPLSVKLFLKNILFALKGGRSLQFSPEPADYVSSEKVAGSFQDQGKSAAQVWWPHQVG